MDSLRTPDDRFVDLPDFPYDPNYAEVADGDGGSLRMHYLDEGPQDGPVVLLMHGEPSWSYLYRHVIATLTEQGHRCIAPDLIGMGRSDKPTKTTDHTYARHVTWMSELIFDHLDLRDATIFGQDWGGLVGLRLVAAEPHRFARVVVGNTGLPTGEERMSDAFFAWQKFSQETPEFPVGAIIDGGTTTPLSDEVKAAYDAPFPDDSYTAGVRIMPTLVPTSPDDPEHDANVAAWKVLETFERPFLCAFSDSDPITKGGDRIFKTRIPGAAGVDHATIVGGGHFLQEDRGVELGNVIAEFVRCS